MTDCRGCGYPHLNRVLDLGAVPAADCFPLATDPVLDGEVSHPLAMESCPDCGLAQLAADDTVTAEPRAVEPQALRDQAEVAVKQVEAAGWLTGNTVVEFGSPHGGTWIPLLTDRGFSVVQSHADVVLDSFGIMHEPDQRRAFEQRAAMMADDGVLLLQYHSLAAIVRLGQWNALRHGHFAYYSLTALVRLLGTVGLRAVTAWSFDLYGGTVLIAAVRGKAKPDRSMLRILAAEDALGISHPAVLTVLQHRADADVDKLRTWLEGERDTGCKVLAYGAGSRTVSLFSRGRIDSRLLAAVADASPAKQGRRMPGTDIPIVSPSTLVSMRPDKVWLTLPDLLPEVSARLPELEGRWHVDGR